jgi:hypothetical protein
VKGIISSVGALMTWTIIPSMGVQTLLIDYYTRHKRSSKQVKEDIHPLDLKESYLTQRESKQNEKKEETILSPPSAVQRETDIIPVDPIVPVDMPGDIAVGHKKACLGSTKLCKRQRNIQVPQGTSRESKRDFQATLQP